ncbi:hypothetical protein [Peribacillus frigoritolerans]|uniref:hypothetical protein n=1 Tax=Peribacillus frigoritolerans TaxID=450367 RepID=UPI0020D217A7
MTIILLLAISFAASFVGTLAGSGGLRQAVPSFDRPPHSPGYWISQISQYVFFFF